MPTTDRDIASLEQIEEAIERLSTEDLLRLRKFAQWRMRAIGRSSRGRDHEDLLYEAITKTLVGERKWPNTRVDFLHHFKTSMSSIADNWNSKKDHGEVLANDLGLEDDDSRDPLDNLGRTEAEQAQRAIDREALAALEESVADDPVVSDVLDGLRAGMSGPEIKEVLEISEKKLRAAIRKIGRHATKLSQRFASLREESP